MRLLRAPRSATQGAARRHGRQSRQEGHERDAPRDWWELNEQGTILEAERSGATLRLGDELAVRVARVDTVRGRVDLAPAG